MGNELGDSHGIRAGDSKVIYLSTCKNIHTINHARIKIMFMCGAFESKSAHEESGDQMFKAGTSLRMTLKSTLERKYMAVGIKGDTMVLFVPHTISIINSNETGFDRWQRLLEGIGGVSEAHMHVLLSSQYKEKFHAWLFNAGGIGCDTIT